MTTDLVVVVPGITGSSLADADGHEVWAIGTRGITKALRTLGRSIRELELPAGLGDGPAPDGVIPTGLMGGFHVIPGIWSPIHGYAALERFLGATRLGLRLDQPDDRAAPPGNLILFPYDWRLSNRWNAELLKARVEPALSRWRASAPERAEAKVVFICHSMGGLVTRWYLDRLGGAPLARTLITLGTPHRGSLKALVELVNGVQKGVGPLKVDVTRLGRSMPSSYQLLPEYACVEGGVVGLRKTTELDLPNLDAEMVRDAMRFHDDLDACPAPSYAVIAVVGIGQPTRTTARTEGERVEALMTIDGRERAGDGTVPRLAARPKRMGERDTGIRGAGEGHSALAVHPSVLHQLDFAITAEDVVYRRAGGPSEDDIVGVSIDDLHAVGEPVGVVVRAPEPRVLEVIATDENGRGVARALVDFRSGHTDDDGRALGTAGLDGLHPGGYAIEVGAPDDPAGDQVERVRHATLVWEG